MKKKSIIVSLVVIVLFIGLVIYAINYKSASVENENNEELQLGTQLPPVDTQVKTQLPTTPEQSSTTTKSMEQTSKIGDTLSMNYTGRLTNGTVFDSNVDPKFGHVQPFEFKLGAGQVIKGWDEGLVGMKVGEKKTLTITPDKGYGAQAIGSIPANSTLIFDVELVAIK